MTTTPALQHTAEPKRCVGIFSFNPFEDDPKLFDTGMRIFIDPVTHDLDTWGPDDEAMSDVEAILDRVIHISGNETKTSDQFIDWCVTHRPIDLKYYRVRSLARLLKLFLKKSHAGSSPW